MKPNLLFIYTDEQAFNTLAAYGNSRIHMPNLNRLASQSVIFDEAYVTQPVCTASRSAILTGTYPHTNGCVENNASLPAGVPCLPEMIANGGYVTGHFGKWHLGDELFAQHGFQEWIGIEDCYNPHFSPGRDRSVRSHYSCFLAERGFVPRNGRYFERNEAARLPEDVGKPAFLAGEASRFLRANRKNPFILYVNFLEPHMPFFGPRDDQYSPDDVPLPANFHDVPTEAQPLKTRFLYERFRRWGECRFPLEDERDWRRLIANYWGLCSLIDTHVGAILQTLEDCGLGENTIVVFTSDHGDMMGAHQLVAKTVMYQEAVRVPCMIRLPGQTEARRVLGPVSQIDLVPTLLDLMDQPQPSHLQGKSLRPWIENPSMRHDSSVFIEWNGDDGGVPDSQFTDWMTAIAPPEQLRAAWRAAVRTVVSPDGWKFNYSPLGEHELYNLRSDPGETDNVISRPEHAEVVARLADEIRRWQMRTGDIVSPPPLEE